MSKPYVIAHRGASGDFPENTLLAFDEAIKQGADIIEMDLQLTSDEEIVVFHDRTVERIFRKYANKSIADFSLEELKKIDVGSWFDEKYNYLRIPTLTEVLEHLPQDISLILEIKIGEESLVKKMIDLLEEKKSDLGKGYISVRDIQTSNLVRKYSDKYKIGLMQKNRTPEEVLTIIRENDVQIAQIRWEKWSEIKWEFLRNQDVKVTVFYADKIEDYVFLLKKEVEGIFTNFPKKLKKYLQTSKLSS